MREKRGFAIAVLAAVSALALFFTTESVRSDGALPIQRIPLALVIAYRDAGGAWSSNYTITDTDAVRTFVNRLNGLEKTEARERLDMMQVDWEVRVEGRRETLCQLEITPDALEAAGTGTLTRVYETDCGALYALLGEIIQLRKSGAIY